MSIAVKVTNDSIKRISKTNTLLDMLLEFENVLDTLDMYAFTNWFKGEILEGPILNRHYITVKLMYPHKDMPDPDGAKRLTARGCIVKYEKDILITPRPVKSFNDVEVEERADGRPKYKAKKKESPVWVVTIQMPRRFVDKMQTDVVEASEDEFVDTEKLTAESEIDSNEQLGGNTDEFGEFGDDQFADGGGEF